MQRRASYPVKRYKRRSRKLAWVTATAVIIAGACLWFWLKPKPQPTPSAELKAKLPVTQTQLPPIAAPKVAPTVPVPAPATTNLRASAPPVTNIPVTPTPPPKPRPLLSDELTPFSDTSPFPRPPTNVFELQLALAREHLCPGSIDGLFGPQTRAALRAFQTKQGLPLTERPDLKTLTNLCLETSPFILHIVSADDLARLQQLSPTWLGKSQQTALAYETLQEMLAEKGHCHPNLLRRLNPSLDWASIQPGTPVRLPYLAEPEKAPRAGFVRIQLAARALQAFDALTNLLAHFPCSIAKHAEQRPVGELHVATVAPDPNYTFDPEIFPESAEGRELNRKLVLPPGPNNPVGLAWVGLDKPGYGIHGTPVPEQVGRTESHGCFRLANWNAVYLVKMVWTGMPVYVEP